METSNILMVVLLSLLGCFCCVLVPAGITIAIVVINRKKKEKPASEQPEA